MKMKSVVLLLAGALFLSACSAQEDTIVTPATPTSETKTFEIVDVDGEFNLYRDFENHYSFTFPKRITFTPCGGTDVDFTTMTIVRDGNNVYLTPEKIAQFDTATDKCSVVSATAETVKQAGGPQFKFVSSEAKNDEEITAFLKQEYAKGCTLKSKKPLLEKENTFELEIETTGPEETEDKECWINYITQTRYNSDLGKIVKWNIGQDVNFVDNTKPSNEGTFPGKAYDFVISESFTFEK